MSTPIINFLSASTIRLELQFKDGVLEPVDVAVGTGFFWKENERIYLITNLHVVTGRDFETDVALDTKNAAIPNYLVGYFYLKEADNSLRSKRLQLSLYKDDKPIWVEHKEKADVVAIPLPPDSALDMTICANSVNDNFDYGISQDVFILGYPKGISVQNLPIWKRGSIASEPSIDAYINKPCFLVDTATKQGMSGAPVYAITSGPYTKGGALMMGDPVKKFLGIYSGRLGRNEMESQLGIVWKKEVIEALFKV